MEEFANEQKTKEAGEKNNTPEMQEALIQHYGEDTNWMVYFSFKVLMDMLNRESSIKVSMWGFGLAVGVSSLGVAIVALGLALAEKGEKEWALIGLGFGMWLLGALIMLIASVLLLKLRQESKAVINKTKSELEQRKNELEKRRSALEVFREDESKQNM
ncbi:hypothetical protein ACFLXV_03555 [Chloroflexota bacterium]